MPLVLDPHSSLTSGSNASEDGNPGPVGGRGRPRRGKMGTTRRGPLRGSSRTSRLSGIQFLPWRVWIQGRACPKRPSIASRMSSGSSAHVATARRTSASVRPRFTSYSLAGRPFRAFCRPTCARATHAVSSGSGGAPWPCVGFAGVTGTVRDGTPTRIRTWITGSGGRYSIR